MEQLSNQTLGASFVLLSSLALACGAHADSITIGGFSTARGGPVAIAGGSDLSTLRASIVSAFPDTTFTGAAVLTPDYLSGIDILFICSAANGNAAIVPLSAAEISAVRGFINRGGSAFLVTDNDSFGGAPSDAANESVLDAVGVDSVGTGQPWPQTATAVNPSTSPVTNGPFGLVTSWNVGWSGWFNVVPAAGNVLGNVNQSGLPALVFFPRHTLAACSGGVVAFSDMTQFADGYYASGGALEKLVRNTITYLTSSTCNGGLCGDLSGDGVVDGADLGALLAQWGTGNVSADLDASGSVDGADLGILLANWGPCS